ncbi:MAG: heme ABC transporter ATP-binding protein [Acidobacteriota bacterium]
MLEAKNITFSVSKKALISDVSAVFSPGKLYLIVGPNGAGKSTLVKTLAGLIHPQSGVVEYEGEDVKSLNSVELARRRAVLSQAIEIAFPLTVREVVTMGRNPHFGSRPGPLDEKIADEMMRLFDIREFEDRNYQTLSGGERQRVNFARILAQLWHSPHDPTRTAETSVTRSPNRYLFLDEPLTFLDIRHQIDFMRTVRDFADQTDVVTVGVLHDLNLAARYADEVLIMNNGRLEASGSPGNVLTAATIRSVFGVEPTFVSAEGPNLHLLFDRCNSDDVI